MINSFTQIDDGCIFADLWTDDHPGIEDRMFF
jgi:hypothetical protein